MAIQNTTTPPAKAGWHSKERILSFHAYVNPGKELVSFMAGQVCVLTAGAPG